MKHLSILALVLVATWLGACTSAPESDAPPAEESAVDGPAAEEEEVGEDAAELAKCRPWKAEGVGLCKMIVGSAWDGKKCVTVGGCSCTGPDCARAKDPGNCAALARACKPARHDCDESHVHCRRATPSCPAGQTPSVVNRCWGPCVPNNTCR